MMLPMGALASASVATLALPVNGATWLKPVVCVALASPFGANSRLLCWLAGWLGYPGRQTSGRWSFAGPALIRLMGRPRDHFI
jgi:hypothetical protein